MSGRYADWLTKQQAAQAIGVSTKTVEKLAHDGKLQQRSLPQQGKPAIVVYHPGDVERVRQERNPDAEPFILPPEGDVPEPAPKALAVAASPTSQNEAALEVLSSKIAEKLRPPDHVRLPERLFLTLKEASEYSGLPPVYLRKLIEEGKLEAVAVNAAGSRRIRRTDLERL